MSGTKCGGGSELGNYVGSCEKSVCNNLRINGGVGCVCPHRPAWFLPLRTENKRQRRMRSKRRVCVSFEENLACLVVGILRERLCWLDFNN